MTVEFVCQRDELVQGIQTVERAASAREGMPILEGIHITAEGNRLKLVATDLELSIECYVPARIQTEGGAVLNGRMFGQIIRKLNADEVAYTTDANGMARIESGRSKFSVHTMDEEEFPALPSVDETPMARTKQADLWRMVKKTVFAAAQDDSRPFLTGVLMELDGEQLKLVATDSSRLAFHRGALSAQVPEEISRIVPVRTLTEVMRLLGDNDSDVEFALSHAQAVFRLGGVQIISRVIEGQFPEYSRALDGLPDNYFIADRASLLGAVERVALVGRRSAPVIRLELEENVLSLTSREAEVGEAFEEVAVEAEATEGSASYQARFLTDVLKALESEKVKIGLGEGLKQGSIVGVDEAEYTYIVMPVRVG